MNSVATPSSPICTIASSPAKSEGRAPFLLRLQRSRTVNTWIKKLALHRLADLALQALPATRSTPAGLVYQIRSVASLVAAQEIFGTEIYCGLLRGETIRHFVDLGCNVGYFPLLLADLTGRRDLRGLVIDGNRTVLTETQVHLQANGLTQVYSLLGLAGFDSKQSEASFLVNPSSHIASTATGKMNPDVPTAGRSVKVKVPCIDVEHAWVQRFGDARIDLLKVDIEGMELELFRNAAALLARSQRIIFEWHKWQVSFADCRGALETAGFLEPIVVWEDAQHGLAYSRRVEA